VAGAREGVGIMMKVLTISMLALLVSGCWYFPGLTACGIRYTMYINDRQGAPMTTRMLAIRIPEKVDRRLARLAKRTLKTKTEIARDALLEHLDDLEDYYLAISRLENKMQSIPLEELEQRLGLAD